MTIVIYLASRVPIESMFGDIVANSGFWQKKSVFIDIVLLHIQSFLIFRGAPHRWRKSGPFLNPTCACVVYVPLCISRNSSPVHVHSRAESACSWLKSLWGVDIWTLGRWCEVSYDISG